MKNEKLLRELKTLKNRNKLAYDNLRKSEKCPFCGQAMKTHLDSCGKERTSHNIAHNHPQELINFLKSVDKNYDSQIQECPICSEKFLSLSNHIIQNHKISWNEFVKTYNWSEPGHKVLEETKRKLSEEKISFYASEKGQKRKEVQSKMMSGENNIACNDEVRKKISLSCMGRKLSDKAKKINSIKSSERLFNKTFANGSTGYFYKWIFNDKYYYARSNEELKVFLSLLINNIEFEIEPCLISYEFEGEQKKYVPDLKIGNHFYEIKPNIKDFEIEKYDAIKYSLNKIGKDLRFLNSSNFKETTGYYGLTKVELENYIRDNIMNGTMTVVLPQAISARSSYPFLKNILGEGFQQIVNSNKEKFNENKKMLSEQNR